MTAPARPPRLAERLLRLHPNRDRRDEIGNDLLELFHARAGTHGAGYARWRYCADVLSVWLRVGRGASERSGGHEPAFAGVLQDIGYAARLFRRQPGVVAVTIAGLGLAIGVCTAVFSLLNAVALRSSGVSNPETAVRVLRAHTNGVSTTWAYGEYVRLRERATRASLESWMFDGASVSLSSGEDGNDRAGVAFVSGGYMQSLGARMAAGRALARSDATPSAAPAIAIGHGYWRRSLGADPSIVGRTIWLNRVPCTVVGVTAQGFTGTADSSTAIWAPIAAYHQIYGGQPFGDRTDTGVNVVGRLKTEVARPEAEAELGAIALDVSRLRVESSGEPISGVRLIGLGDPLDASDRSRTARVVGVVTVVIGLVLVLACVNVANLLLASAAARQREIGVRLALGASRRRIVRQLLTESVVLSLVGGAIGLWISIWLVHALAAVTRPPAGLDLSPDLRVYLFMLAVSVAAGIGAGLAPAQHGTKGDVTSSLKGEEARTGAPPRPRLRSVLIGVQAAASITLLVLAALLTRATLRAAQIDVGFEADRLLTVRAAFGREPYDAAAGKAYWAEALERARALPGVQAASLVDNPPFGVGSTVSIVRREGRRYTVFFYQTGADYFGALGARVARGRTFTAAEAAGGAQVAVISETLARDFWPGEDPVGSTLDRVKEGSGDVVIGVVSDSVTARLRDLSGAAVYLPLREFRGASMIVRTADARQPSLAAIRTAIQPIDPRVRVSVGFVADGLRRELDESRTVAALAGALGLLALGLAIVGIHGMTAFAIGQRTREVSIRLAVGATARDVLSLLLTDSLRPVVIGLGAGILTALAGARVLSAALYGISPADPAALLAATAVLLIAAAAAVIVPAVRATRTDPARILHRG